MRRSALFFILLLTHQVSSAQIVVDRPKLSNEIQDTRERIFFDHTKYFNQLENSGPRQQFNIAFTLRGESIEFKATRNDVVDTRAQIELNGIRTFDLKSLNNTNIIFGALTLSPEGLYATILDKGKLVSILPENFGKSNWYIVEYGSQRDFPKPKQWCGHDHDEFNTSGSKDNNKNNGPRAGFTIGSKRYNYRVAVVVTGEFYQKNGNNDAEVNMVVVNTINALSAIYSNELSSKLSIGSRIFRYTDPNTDPFIPNETGGESRTTQAGKVVPMHFNSSLFDIGHVFHQH